MGVYVICSPVVKSSITNLSMIKFPSKKAEAKTLELTLFVDMPPPPFTKVMKLWDGGGGQIYFNHFLMCPHFCMLVSLSMSVGFDMTCHELLNICNQTFFF